ncbi:MAG: tRNA(Ile)-lysidine synthase [Nitrospirales bacterium]|nr:MAG: tRNA(Ile)-lysidine synthase [Nitrospirales bacterium]
MHIKQMLVREDHVLVSVSGGPDSVALLAVLHRLRETWNVSLRVVHVDHGLRGQESDEDAVFVVQLCQMLEIPCIVEALPVQRHDVQSSGSSLQEYARNIRYQALSRIAAKTGATKIATGHTLDDQAETIVMRMVRGSGTAGLCGIPAMRDAHIIRPLLGTSRQDVLSYLQQQGLSYRVDSSNQTLAYLRNRIRHEVMPRLAQYNPNILKTMARQADIACQEEAYLDQLAVAALADIQHRKTDDAQSLCRDGLLHLPLALRRRVIRLVLHAVSRIEDPPGFEAVDTVLQYLSQSRSGSEIRVHGVSIVREYACIHVHAVQTVCGALEKNHWYRQELAIPSHGVWPLTGQTFEVSVSTGMRPDTLQQASPYQACFDADTFHHALVLRSWQEGDRFYPLGMGGKKKKLQDFFSDIKLARSRRALVPLLVAPEGIVWVGGYRMDHRFRVTENTQHVLMVHLSRESNPL